MPKSVCTERTSPERSRRSRSGFTLIELLVVIAIMAIIGAYTIANYSSFGEDQNLKNAVLDIQSQLHAAQTSATANAKCDTGYGATWQVVFSADKVTTNMNCQEPLLSPPPSPLPTPTSKKTLQLGANITIDSVSGTNCPTALPFTISFAPLTGKTDLGNASCTLLTVTLKNNQTGTPKSLIIEQGGRIYGQ